MCDQTGHEVHMDKIESIAHSKIQAEEHFVIHVVLHKRAAGPEAHM